MASVLRAGLANINSTGLLVGLCKLTSKRHNVAITQIARISGRELRRDRPPRPPPYDWRNKGYSIWAYHTDPMLERFDDNTKVVIVEGMPSVGKDKFSRKLAEELEMMYIPPPSFDELWINSYGFDHRSLNNQLPIDCQFYDIQSFLEDPTSRNSGAMQISMFWMRCNQYIDNLAHVLSTGQGVVAQRTPWTDSIFIEAMYKCGYVSRGVFDYHKCAVEGTVHEFLRPHLVVYLDAPISVIKDNIKKRNIPYEVNSKALTTQYLEELERLYKDYLREASKHSHLLIYDWSREGDIGVVIEDIERLDFDNVASDDLKFLEWKWDREFEIKQLRHDFSARKNTLLAPINIARFDIPELIRTAENNIILEHVLEKVPSEKFAPGFHPDYDKGILFKLRDYYEDWVPQKKVTKTK